MEVKSLEEVVSVIHTMTPYGLGAALRRACWPSTGWPRTLIRCPGMCVGLAPSALSISAETATRAWDFSDSDIKPASAHPPHLWCKNEGLRLCPGALAQPELPLQRTTTAAGPAGSGCMHWWNPKRGGCPSIKWAGLQLALYYPARAGRA